MNKDNINDNSNISNNNNNNNDNNDEEELKKKLKEYFNKNIKINENDENILFKLNSILYNNSNNKQYKTIFKKFKFRY